MVQDTSKSDDLDRLKNRPTESEVVAVLEENGGLRIDELASELDVEFSTAKEAIVQLWEKNRVVSGPRFEFELTEPRFDEEDE